LPKEPTYHDVLFRAGVGFLFVILIWFWKRIVARWYSLQQVLYARICELEEELSLYKERYIHWLTEYSRDGTLPADEQGRRAMPKLRPLHVRVSVRKTVAWLANILIAVWLLFIALHIAAMMDAKQRCETEPRSVAGHKILRSLNVPIAKPSSPAAIFAAV
jgi:hypothetical protein